MDSLKDRIGYVVAQNDQLMTADAEDLCQDDLNATQQPCRRRGHARVNHQAVDEQHFSRMQSLPTFDHTQQSVTRTIEHPKTVMQ